ncbi:MAG: sigma-70 family RNA polymerase sigma factor [Candidatus Andersenbacteria bacterium]|nr:sigma-70 family RNA polymerase sigma factor [Candidatus Andersenbacteria bacterium]
MATAYAKTTHTSDSDACDLFPSNLPPPVSSQEVREFIAEHGAGTPDTIEFLCRTNLRLIPYCLRRLASSTADLPPSLDEQDLFQEGFIALRSAAQWYEPARGTAFSTLAVNCIQKRLRTVIMTARRRARRRVSLDDINTENMQENIPDDDDRLLRHGTNYPLLRRLLQRALQSGLTDREKSVVIKRFGLAGKPPETLNTLAKQWGISRERVRQVQMRALEKLRDHFVHSRSLKTHMIF